MKYLFLILVSLNIQAGLEDLDLTIPEQPAVYVPPEKEFYLNLGDYNEPPTKAQVITFWTLNLLDVYITHKAVQKPTIYETNPILPKKPKLEEQLLQKVILGGIIHKHSSKRYMTVVNVALTYAVINNYELIK